MICSTEQTDRAASKVDSVYKSPDLESSNDRLLNIYKEQNTSP